MDVLEMWNRVLIESGQFLLNAGNVQPDQERFVTLVKSVTGFWNRYNPVTDQFNISVNKRYTFDSNSQSYGIPDSILELVPLELSGTMPVGLFDEFNAGFLNRSFNHSPYSVQSIDKRSLPFEYRKPDLYVPISGNYDIKAAYSHKVTKTDGGHEVKTVSDDDFYFFEFLRAKFLVSVGRNRRAFTIDELPIQTDASELVQEGLRLEEKVKEEIQNDSSFYLAWG